MWKMGGGGARVQRNKPVWRLMLNQGVSGGSRRDGKGGQLHGTCFRERVSRPLADSVQYVRGKCNLHGSTLSTLQTVKCYLRYDG